MGRCPPRSRSRAPGLHRLSGDRRIEARTESRDGRIRTLVPGSVPEVQGGSAARPPFQRRKRRRDAALPQKRSADPRRHHRRRSRRRRSQRNGDGHRTRRALWALAVAPASWAHRPRRGKVPLRAGRAGAHDRRSPRPPGSYGAHVRRIRDRRNRSAVCAAPANFLAPASPARWVSRSPTLSATAKSWNLRAAKLSPSSKIPRRPATSIAFFATCRVNGSAATTWPASAEALSQFHARYRRNLPQPHPQEPEGPRAPAHQ